MDNLEKFIQQEREQFDMAMPSLKVWAEIDKELDQKRGRRVALWKGLRIAAAVVFLMTIGGVIGSYLTQVNNPGTMAVIQEIIPEYAEIENFYNKEVNTKIKQLASYDTDQTVREDLAQIDKVSEELKRELMKAPKGSEEQIVNNLIKNYQTKLAILERVLKRIESTKQKQIKPANDEVSI